MTVSALSHPLSNHDEPTPSTACSINQLIHAVFHQARGLNSLEHYHKLLRTHTHLNRVKSSLVQQWHQKVPDANKHDVQAILFHICQTLKKEAPADLHETLEIDTQAAFFPYMPQFIENLSRHNPQELFRLCFHTQAIHSSEMLSSEEVVQFMQVLNSFPTSPTASPTLLSLSQHWQNIFQSHYAQSILPYLKRALSQILAQRACLNQGASTQEERPSKQLKIDV